MKLKMIPLYTPPIGLPVDIAKLKNPLYTAKYKSAM